jgi:hypothetical protein
LTTGGRSFSRACWLSFAFWPAFGGCDLFSFPAPEPLSLADPESSAGAGGQPEPPLITALGDLCVLGGDSCGVDESGADMTCFRGSALAGQDFCAPACSSDHEPAPDHVCTAEGALLPACHPSLAEPEADCPAGLNCYRTSLFADQGICVSMPVCSTNSDCRDPLHGTCTAEIVRNMLGPAAASLLPLDHLNCAQPSCSAYKMDCSKGEACLSQFYDPTVADICTPLCDSELHCPPNYSCAQATSGEGSRAVCVPGLPGNRCDGPHCVVGNCEDTGAGFSVCTIPCTSTSDCAKVNTDNDSFYCVDGGAGQHCVISRPFHGANCDHDDQCREDLNEFCSDWDARGRDASPHECRQRCKPDGTCDPRGGLAHTCLWGGKGGCFPGEQGLPCTLPSECLEGLSCEAVPEEADKPDEPEELALNGPICTRPCGGESMTEAAADEQCSPPRTVNGHGYCAGGFCRPKRGEAKRCSRDAQCASGLCNTAKGTCLATPLPGLSQ